MSNYPPGCNGPPDYYDGEDTEIGNLQDKVEELVRDNIEIRARLKKLEGDAEHQSDLAQEQAELL